jgi:hypothetical protein
MSCTLHEDPLSHTHTHEGATYVMGDLRAARGKGDRGRATVLSKR